MFRLPQQEENAVMTSIGRRNVFGAVPRLRVPQVQPTLQLVGLVLVGGGLLLGLGALWVQLGRALPLAELLHRPRAARAAMMTGAGLGVLLLGRRGPVIASLKGMRFPLVHWVPDAREAMQLAGVVLVGAGLLLGFGALWVQLARALPLDELLHRPQSARAMLVAGAGLGLLFLGRRGSASPNGRAGLPTRPHDDWLIRYAAPARRAHEEP
jgi:hypothetical protein